MGLHPNPKTAWNPQSNAILEYTSSVQYQYPNIWPWWRGSASRRPVGRFFLRGKCLRVMVTISHYTTSSISNTCFWKRYDICEKIRSRLECNHTEKTKQKIDLYIQTWRTSHLRDGETDSKIDKSRMEHVEVVTDHRWWNSSNPEVTVCNGKSQRKAYTTV